MNELDSPERVSKLFGLTVELGIELGWENLSSHPGCAEHQVDDQWWFAINPHGEASRCSQGTRIPPYTIYYQFNGWPAGFCTAHGGAIAAGKLANEETLITAIESAIKKEQRKGPQKKDFTPEAKERRT